ncbi:LysE family translocator [Corallincola holothuriorum]|uniref:LysE family translocator n=1 Tax=Corallincola holothuriorum TaxID=2282215 RepID=A0A368NMT7_9GAMM|nr:LysE family translocator [Corallincola holothuriorum]RCU51892.1 LysE family translocator [Corallincola holothuriorum]
MTTHSLLLFSAVSLGLIIVPGPLILLTISTALQFRFNGAIWLTLGSVTSGAIKAVLAMTGIAALLQLNPVLLSGLQGVGALYLLWLAWQLSRTTDEKQTPTATAINHATKRQLYMRGLFSALANPKGILFFAALFPQFIDSEHALWSQTLTLMLIFSSIEITVMLLYAAATVWLNRSMGVLNGGKLVGQRITPMVLLLLSIMMFWELFAPIMVE